MSSRTLADGLLPVARQVLYTVPDGMIARIRWMSGFNSSGAGNVLTTIFLRRFGESRRFARADLAASGGQARYLEQDEDLVLAEGDAIEGLAVTGDVVEFTISGEEEPAPDA